VLYIHGSAWLYGGRASDGAAFDQMQRSLIGRGFVLASIDYGLGSLYQFPAQIDEAKCAGRAASAVTYIGPRQPPYFIVHGTKDPLVPVGQSKELAQRLQAAGTPARLVLVPNAGHVGMDPAMAGATTSVSSASSLCRW